MESGVVCVLRELWKVVELVCVAGGVKRGGIGVFQEVMESSRVSLFREVGKEVESVCCGGCGMWRSLSVAGGVESECFGGPGCGEWWGLCVAFIHVFLLTYKVATRRD